MGFMLADRHEQDAARDVEGVSRELGVVGEGASVRQLYLTYASRMLIDDWCGC